MATIPFFGLDIPTELVNEELPRRVGRLVTENGKTIGRVLSVKLGKKPSADVALIGKLDLKGKALNAQLELFNLPA